MLSLIHFGIFLLFLTDIFLPYHFNPIKSNAKISYHVNFYCTLWQLSNKCNQNFLCSEIVNITQIMEHLLHCRNVQNKQFIVYYPPCLTIEKSLFNNITFDCCETLVTFDLFNLRKEHTFCIFDRKMQNYSKSFFS